MPRAPFDSSDIVFFFGAGASASFGIPTMKQMVIEFERELSKNGTWDETRIYNNIKTTLERELGEGNVDLEAIFTVIDGLINYDVERLGLLALYASATSLGRLLTDMPPEESTVATCKALRTKFQNFVREQCLPSEEAYGRISEVYRDFFNRLYKESETSRSDIFLRTRSGHLYCNTWTMFTTNYDTCLEYYWRQVARVTLNTGFSVQEATRTWVLNPDVLCEPDRSELRLLKLHGSVSWQIASDNTVTEEQSIMGRQLVGRRFVGDMMLYPVQQKELYLEPYISMLKELNRELERKSNWIVVGYSFNDPVIREIFLRSSDEDKKLTLVHPSAQEIIKKKLDGIKCGKISMLDQKFGEDNFASVDYSVVTQFVQTPKHESTNEV